MTEMTATLSAFQQAFAASLLSDSGRFGPAAQPAFAVYRNTVMKGCIDALRAGFPGVLRVVGESWFNAAAAAYVRCHPPSDACLLLYGEGFDRFLADFSGAADLPYLPGVARLDRLRSASHVARDAAPLDAAELAALAPDQLGQCRLPLHPAARWAWFDAPVFSIWRAQTAQQARAVAWQPEGVLVTRPLDAVQMQPLEQSGGALLDACASGATLGEAAAAALACTPDVDLAQLLAALLQAGAFADARTEPDTHS